MRAWILRYGTDGDGSRFQWETAPGHISAASWVDGAGDVADTCEVTLEAVDGAGVAKLLSSRLSLLLVPPAHDGVDDLLCYGPYDVEPASVDGEARMWRLSGRIGSHFEATIADRDDEDEFYSTLETAITETLTTSEPWQGWATGAGAPSADESEDYEVDSSLIMQLAASQMVNAQDLSGVRQIMAQWGMTAIPYVSAITATGFSHRVRVDPLHRPETTGFTVPSGWAVRLGTLELPASFGALDAASTLDLSNDHLDAHPSVAWADGLNRVGDYRIRQVSAIQKQFGHNTIDNVILQAGTLRPPVYLDPDNGPALMKVREEIERWKLQNQAAVMTATRRFATPYASAAHAFITPSQLLTVGLHHLPPGVTELVWQVRQVNHAWDGEEGYRQTIKASLWQGPFWRTSGSAVRAISL